MKVVFDYLSGAIGWKEFMDAVLADDSVINWLQGLIPEGAEIIDIPKGNGQLRGSSHPFWNMSDRAFMAKMPDTVSMEHFFKEQNHYKTSGGRLNAYVWIYKLVKKVYPDIEEHMEVYRDEFIFNLDTCGECYASRETEEYIDRIVSECYYLPLSKTQRKKICKERLKVAFSVEDGKRPYWVQGSLWPMGRHRPMKYLSRKKDGERYEYRFIDVDTGEERIIEDFM